MKSDWENKLQRSAGKFRPIYMLLAGNNTVPISTWRAGDVRCAVFL